MKEYKCPKCRRFIKGTTEKHLQHNIMVHNIASIECLDRAEILNKTTTFLKR